MEHLISRRGLTVGLVAAPLAAQTPTITPQAEPAQSAAGDDLAAAREQIRRNSDLLANASVPMAVEPSFAFHP